MGDRGSGLQTSSYLDQYTPDWEIEEDLTDVTGTVIWHDIPGGVQKPQGSLGPIAEHFRISNYRLQEGRQTMVSQGSHQIQPVIHRRQVDFPSEKRVPSLMPDSRFKRGLGAIEYLPLSAIRIKFFIRTYQDPTGSNSPSITVSGDTKLCEVFHWYLSKSYSSVPRRDPELQKDYCLVEIDLPRRTLGEKYYYEQVKESKLRMGDTKWWRLKSRRGNPEVRKIWLVSNDRVPKGNYTSHMRAP